MPWTAAEAHGHTKKASTKKKKKQWRIVANSILKRTGNEARAIRGANAAVGDRFWDGDIFLKDEFKNWFDIRYRKIIRRGPTGSEEGTYEEEVDDAVLGDREFTSKQREKAAESGAAMKGGGFPIHNKEDLANARQALGRAKNRAATIAHIKKRARALGVKLPENWPNDADPFVSRVAQPRFAILE